MKHFSGFFSFSPVQDNRDMFRMCLDGFGIVFINQTSLIQAFVGSRAMEDASHCTQLNQIAVDSFFKALGGMRCMSRWVEGQGLG